MAAGNLAFYLAVALALILAYWIISEKRKAHGTHLGRENIFRRESDVIPPERVKEMWFIPQRVRAERPKILRDLEGLARPFRSDAEKHSAIPLIKPTREARTQAPVKGACTLCEKHVTMPFKCKFCGSLYCDEHRMPESHNCAGLKKLRREQKRSA